MVKKKDKTEDYFSLEKKKKHARKIFLIFSIPLFLGLMALVGLSLFYSDVYAFLVGFGSGNFAQLLSFFNFFLVPFVVIFGGVFTWNLWKYISTKKKMREFHKDF